MSSPSRYFSDLHDDGKSGYRPAVGYAQGTIPVTDYICDYIRIFGPQGFASLIRAAEYHAYERSEATNAVAFLMGEKRIKFCRISHQYYLPDSEDTPVWLWARRKLVGLWHRIFPSFLAAWFFTFVALGLCAQEFTSGKWVAAEITAYCPCAICCGKFADGKTANMTDVKRVPYNFAASNSLAFGSKVYLPSGQGLLDNIRAHNRWFLVDDRGGALDTEEKRNGFLRLDLRVRDHWQARQYGRRIMHVFVVN